MRSIMLLLSATSFSAAATLLSTAPAALAQDSLPTACRSEHAGHMMGGGSMTDTSGMNDFQKAYAAAMDRMHAPMMSATMATDPDVAFVCGMIPHHQGAIDMAKVVLEYGKDPWVKQLAQNVIDAQSKEIADMTKWLEDHAK